MKRPQITDGADGNGVVVVRGGTESAATSVFGASDAGAVEEVVVQIPGREEEEDVFVAGGRTRVGARGADARTQTGRKITLGLAQQGTAFVVLGEWGDEKGRSREKERKNEKERKGEGKE